MTPIKSIPFDALACSLPTRGKLVRQPTRQSAFRRSTDNNWDKGGRWKKGEDHFNQEGWWWVSEEWTITIVAPPLSLNAQHCVIPIVVIPTAYIFTLYGLWYCPLPLHQWLHWTQVRIKVQNNVLCRCGCSPREFEISENRFSWRFQMTNPHRDTQHHHTSGAGTSHISPRPVLPTRWNPRTHWVSHSSF